MISLSKTSKMPCPSYSLPISSCKVGSKLAKIPGTVCFHCYAKRGFYNMARTKIAMDRRLKEIKTYDWVDRMCEAIEPYKYFRWHDSGDIQDTEHLHRIMSIANNLSSTKFWLPTKEKTTLTRTLNSQSKPDNLIIRLSSVKVDHLDKLSARHAEHGILQSVSSNSHLNGTYACQASQSCGKCRACWDQSISVVNYKMR